MKDFLIMEKEMEREAYIIIIKIKFISLEYLIYLNLMKVLHIHLMEKKYMKDYL